MTKHFAALDGLRGVLALTVVIYHCSILSVQSQSPFSHGYLAVDFFLLLSGFVIAEAYEPRLRNGQLSAANFFFIRAVRLGPMIILGALLGAIAAWLTTGQPVLRIAAAAISAALLLPDPWFSVPPFMWPINVPFWSLFFEAIGNVAFALWLYRLSSQHLLAILIISFAALAVTAYLNSSLNMGANPATFPGGLPRLAFGFIGGIVLNRLHRFNFLPHWRGNLWILTGVTLAVLAFPLHRFSGAIDLTIVTIVFPCILLIGINTNAGSPFWSWSGRLSYPIYAIHYPVLVVTAAVAHASPERLSPPLAYCIVLAATLVLAATFLLLIDEPVRSALTSRMRESKALSHTQNQANV